MTDHPAPPTPEDLLQHASWIRGLARALLRDEAAAEDVVQQTWEAAIQHRPSPRFELRRWLWVVARHFALRRRRQDRRFQGSLAPDALPASASDPALAVERGERARLVLDAVLKLPEPSRRLLLLRYFEGRPPREIARVTGMTGDAVRSQLKRARTRLRSRLAAEFGDGWSSLCLPLAGPPWWLSGPFLVSTMSKPIRIVVAAVLLLASLVFVSEFAGPDDPAPEQGPLAARPAAGPSPVPGLDPAAEAVRRPVSSNGAGTARGKPRLQLVLVDGGGNPVPGARASVFVPNPWEDAGRLRSFDFPERSDPLAAAVSDQDGRIRLERPGLDGGLTLLVRAPGLSMAGGVYLDAPSPEEDWDLGALVLEAGRTIRVHVVDDQGQPVPGARVAISGSRGPREWWNQHEFTDVKGTAEFPCAPLRADFVSVESGSFLRKHEVFDAEQDGLDPLVLTLVVDPGVGFRVVVVDQGGAPVSGAEVFAQEIELPANTRTDRVYGVGLREPNLRGLTASDGSLQVHGLQQQSRHRGCWVAARKDGAVAAVHPVAPGDEIRLVLPRAVEVQGSVLDADGAPAAGAELALLDVDRPLWPPAFEGRTDQAGRFSCRLSAGRYAVFALHENGWMKKEDPLLLDRDTGALDLKLKLEGGCALELEVLSAAGAPIPLARLSHPYPSITQYSAPEPTDLAWTGVVYRFLGDRRADRSGRLLVGCLPPGPRQLSLGAPGFERDRFELEVPEKGLLRVTRELQPKAPALPAVLVQVRDVLGELVPRAELRFLSPQGELQGDGFLPETSSRGEHSFRPTEEGLWEVSAEKDGRRSPVAVFEVRRTLGGDPLSPVLLELPSLAELEVVVLRASEPVAGCLVGVGRAPMEYSGRQEPLLVKARAVTDEGGRAVFLEQPPGPRGLRIEAPSGFPLELTTELAPGPNTVEVQVSGVTVSGTLPGAGAEGEVYLGRILTQANPDRLVRSMMSRSGQRNRLDVCRTFFGQIGTVLRCDLDGSFRFEDVPAGEYLLLATAPGFQIAAPQWISVAGSPVGGIQVALAPAGSVTVHLTGVKQARQNGGVDILVLEAQHGGEKSWPRIDKLLDGDVSCPKLAPGLWQFRLNAKDLDGVWTVLDEVAVEVTGGGHSDLTLRAVP